MKRMVTGFLICAGLGVALVSCGNRSSPDKGQVAKPSLAAETVHGLLELTELEKEESIKADAKRITDRILETSKVNSEFLENCHLTTSHLNNLNRKRDTDVLGAIAEYKLGLTTDEPSDDYRRGARMLAELRLLSERLRTLESARLLSSSSLNYQDIAGKSLAAGAKHQSPELQVMMIEVEADSYLKLLAECIERSTPN